MRHRINRLFCHDQSTPLRWHVLDDGSGNANVFSWMRCMVALEIALWCTVQTPEMLADIAVEKSEQCCTRSTLRHLTSFVFVFPFSEQKEKKNVA